LDEFEDCADAGFDKKLREGRVVAQQTQLLEVDCKGIIAAGAHRMSSGSGESCIV